jgi:hypothetical protein
VKKPVEVVRWNADANDAPLNVSEPTEGPMAGKLVCKPAWVNVHLDMRMTREAYDEFRDMMQKRWGATDPGAAPKPLPPASPKLPAHDVIDAEFAEVGEDE